MSSPQSSTQQAISNLALRSVSLMSSVVIVACYRRACRECAGYAMLRLDLRAYGVLNVSARRLLAQSPACPVHVPENLPSLEGSLK